MVKRTTSIVFLLLAYLVILAQSVVPHHHHQKQVCLIVSHCTDDENQVSNGLKCNHHAHDGENNSENCILKEPVILPSNQLKLERIQDNDGNYNYRNGYFGCEANNNTSNSYSSLQPNFIHLLENQFRHPLIPTTSSGLRAPPVI